MYMPVPRHRSHNTKSRSTVLRYGSVDPQHNPKTDGFCRLWNTSSLFDISDGLASHSFIQAVSVINAHDLCSMPSCPGVCSLVAERWIHAPHQ